MLGKRTGRVVSGLQNAGSKGRARGPLAVLAASLRLGGAAAVVAVLVGTALPVAAQQSGIGPSALDNGRQQDPMSIAAAVNMRRSRLYEQQDTAGIASLYTEDATYVELMPILQIFKGQDQIKGHLDELLGASAVGLVPTVTQAKLNSDGTILVGGDYLVLSREGAETDGHFVQRLL